MCGICGMVSLKNAVSLDPTLLDSMGQIMSHRGPDDGGEYRAEGVGLGHRRLSIVDLSRGHQPMSNETGSVWIVFNGEIYNHAELKPGLIARGHQFRTDCDTETIIHLYEEYGEDCVNYLRGMFAFAIWNNDQKTLFLARDRLGVKPLYYTIHQNILYFASEIKAILTNPSIPRSLNEEAVPEYLAFRYVSGEETLFKGIKRLLPGHFLCVTNGDIRIQEYWDLHFPQELRSISEGEAAEELDELLEQSVRMRLMSDVPLGVFLSGGIDSSTIAWYMTELIQKPIRTFSVGFAELNCSELPYASLMARALGSQHSDILVSATQFMDSLPELIWHHDEPLCFSASIPLYFVSKLAGTDTRVILSGEGADETFAGYGRYAATLWNARYGEILPDWTRKKITRPLSNAIPLPGRMKTKIHHSFLARGHDLQDLYLENFLVTFPEDSQKNLLTSEFSGRKDGHNPYRKSLDYLSHADSGLLNRLLYHDTKGYLVDLLMKQDKMSMAASIETRVPFLDHKLVEFCASLPVSFKLNGMMGKYLLRKVMEERLPAEILKRPKQGFPVPVSRWFRNECYSDLQEILLDSGSKNEIFRQDTIERMFHEHREGVRDWSDQLWTLANFNLWESIFLKGSFPNTKSSLRKVKAVVS